MTKLAIKQAFIFAAGRGERMRPLTDSIPKPLIKVNNKSIIDYIIEKLDKIPSIERIIINCFYLSNQLEEHIRKLNNPKIIFSHEVEKLETGGGLVFASDKINLNEPLLTINGDILWQEKDGISDIEIICKAWKGNDCNILLGLKKSEDFFGYDKSAFGGDFILEKDGQIFKFDNKIMNYVFVGLQIINPKILKKAPEKCFSMSYFYKSAVGYDGMLNKIKGVELLGKYFHISNPRILEEVNQNQKILSRI